MECVIYTILKWLGRIARMQDNAPCKKINPSHPEGRRRKEDSN
jgi:hypothetical protein